MEFEKLSQERRSLRSYQENVTITEEEYKEILQGAQLAPTWKNSQTGRYYIVKSQEMREDFRAKVLPGFNQKSSANADLIVTTFVKDIAGFTKGEPDNELGNEWGAYDLGLQNAYLLLKAKDLGYDTLIMGLRHQDVIREMLQIPENEEIVSVIAIGKGQGEVLFRPRKDLDEIVKFF